MSRELPRCQEIPLPLWMQVVGWYGMAVILLGYALSSFGVLGQDRAIYQMLNFTGAVGIVVVSVRQRAYQPALLNAVWLVVAAIALVRLLVA